MRSSFPTEIDASDVQIALSDLEFLSRLARDLTAALTLESAWDGFVDNVSNLIPYDRIVLALYDPDRKILRNELESGLRVPGLRTGESVPIEGSIGGAVVSDGEGVLDSSIDAEFVVRFPVAEPLLVAGIRSVMALPLTSGGSVAGVLHIQSRTRHSYGEREWSTGSAVAALAGGRMGSLGVIRRLESRVYDLSQAGAERQILTDIAAIVSSSLNISDVYIPFCERVGQLIPWDRIVIQTLSGDGTTLTDRYSSGDGPRNPGATMSVEGTLAADVIGQRKTLRVAATNEAELAEVVRKYPALERSANLGQRSGMVSPLISGDEVIGVMQIGSRQPGIYTEKHQQFADQIAVSVASAIRNADLHEEVKRAADERERLAARDARAAEIERRAKERAVFVSQLSHELKTPLTSVGLFAELLELRVAKQGDARGLSHIEGIIRNARRMERLIGDLMDVSAMETGQLGLKKSTFDISEVLREVVEDFLPHASQQNQSITLEPPDGAQTELTADRERVSQVVSILIDNACKHGGAGTSIVVALSRNDGGVRIEVEDSGAGLQAHEIEQVFDRFYRGQGSSATGTGIGLYMARSIVEAHGGSIRAANGLKAGAKFVVELPA